MLVFLCLLLCSQLVVLANASSGSKVTTFHIGDFGPTVCDLDVHFSWDGDSWKVGDKHTISFSFEVKNVNPNVVNLDLNINQIIIRLKSEIFHNSIDLISKNVSNQITQLVWRQSSTTILNTPRSFTYEIDVPKPIDQIAEDKSVKLYYLVKLSGNSYYEEVGGTNLHGGGQIDEYVSNEGTMSGGIEDPVGSPHTR